MNYEEKKRFDRQQEVTFGTLYKVTYIKSPGNYGEICPKRGENSYYTTKEFIVDNINGYGIGTVFFSDCKERLVVLPWSAIISMIPVENAELIMKSNGRIDMPDEILQDMEKQIVERLVDRIKTLLFEDDRIHKSDTFYASEDVNKAVDTYDKLYK